MSGKYRPDLEPFRQALVRAMQARRMSKSDLARAVWGEQVNRKTGRWSAKRRDAISQYCAATTYPDLETRTKLADALGISVEALAKTPDPKPREFILDRLRTLDAEVDRLKAERNRLIEDVENGMVWFVEPRVHPPLEAP